MTIIYYYLYTASEGSVIMPLSLNFVSLSKMKMPESILPSFFF